MKKYINLSIIMEYVLYLFIFLLPWQSRYIFRYLSLGGEEYEYGKLSVYLSEVVLLLLFLLFVINWIINGIPKNQMRKSFAFSFLFLVVVSLGYVIAVDRQMFSYAILRLSEATFLLFVLSKIKFDFFRIATSFVISILIHTSIGIYQFFSQGVIANKYLGIAEQITSNYGVSVLKNDAGRFLRAYGGMSHPNILGGFIAIAVLFLFILFVKYYSKIKIVLKIVLHLSLFILSAGLILTFSRSAYLALFVSIMILFAYFIYRKKFYIIKPFVVILFLSFMINFAIFNDLIITRIFSSDISADISGIERIELNKQASSVIKNNLLLGVGVGNYIPYVFSSNVNRLEMWQYQPVHNIFMLILSETGIMGLLTFLLALIFSSIEKIKTNNYYDFILFSALLLMVVISLLDHYFITSFSGIMIIFVFLGLDAQRDLNFLN